MTEVIAALIGAVGAIMAAWVATRRPGGTKVADVDKDDDQLPRPDNRVS